MQKLSFPSQRKAICGLLHLTHFQLSKAVTSAFVVVVLGFQKLQKERQLERPLIRVISNQKTRATKLLLLTVIS